MSILVYRQDRYFYRKYGKRILDVLFSTFALIVLTPLFYLLMVAITIESHGGPFFFQKRFGKGFKPFRLIKFRSMLPVTAGSTKDFEPGCTARITTVGRILRKTKADELPTLFNVLFGEMSLVGPRPEVEKYIRTYPEDFKTILKILPGLSDYASIKYRDEETILGRQPDPEHYYCNVIMPDKLLLAKKYAKDASFGTDIRIIGQTIRRIIGKAGCIKI